MAVRQVSNRGGNIIGKFPSLKLGRMVAYESLIEMDYLYQLDYEPAVERFEEQPLTLEYRFQGQSRRYTPDFYVFGSQGHHLVECKPEGRLQTEANQRKFAAARQWCAGRDWEFCLVTDQTLRAGYCLQNVKLLTQYARHCVPPEVRARLLAGLQTAPTASVIRDLLRQWPSHETPLVFASLLHLAFHQELDIPLDLAPISFDSPIQLPLAQTGEALR